MKSSKPKVSNCSHILVNFLLDLCNNPLPLRSLQSLPRNPNYEKLILAVLLAGVGTPTLAGLQIKNRNLKIQDLSPHMQSEYYEIQMQNYRLEKSFWEEVLFQDHVKKTASKQGISVDQAEAKILSASEPTEKELKEFYDQNKAKISYPFDAIKGQLKGYVLENKKREKKAEVIAKITAKGEGKLTLKEPVAPKFKINTEKFFSRGNGKSKVTIVEFADYKCPHCAHAAKVMEKVYGKYKDKVNFVFIDFPILKGFSEDIAKAAFCANEQGAYWKFHKDVFNNQQSVDQNYIKTLSSKLGLDSKKFEACQGSKAAADVVTAGKAEGERLGIRGTPTIYINGQKWSGGLTEKQIAKALDSALKG